MDDPSVFLHKHNWKTVTLESVTKLSHDSYILKFPLPSPDVKFGLPVGQHVFVRLARKQRTNEATEGEPVVRAYTPVTQPGAQGYVEFLIKFNCPALPNPCGQVA